MERIVTGEQMQLLDKYTIEEMGVPSFVLMERAGLFVFEAIKKEGFSLNKILILCGSGNNGADGVVLARLLHLAGYCTDVCILGKPEKFTKEMQKQIDIGKNYGISFVKSFHISEYTVIVDAVFGVGLSREITGNLKEIILELHKFQGKIVAVDIPSGICSRTGKILGCAVKADLTVTFAYGKTGLFLYPGAEYAGKVVIADIGIYAKPEILPKPEIFTYTKEDLKEIRRKKDGNKGSFGKILLIAGSKDIFGAAYLSGMAAMRTGAGMLKICTHKENKTLFSCFPEAMLLCYEDDENITKELSEGFQWADVIGIGPGIGLGKQAESLLDTVLSHGTKPLVIDADAIGMLKGRTEQLKNYPNEVILTPHLGEFSRLTDISIKKWKENPIKITQEIAKTLSVVLVCKDARTVISNGDKNIYLNLSGNDGMASAGSGDVLTGMILSLLAQGKDGLKAACLGVYLHGAAGDLAAKRKGRAAMLAGDLIDAAGQILDEV